MDMKQLIELLNEDLSHEYSAIVQYLTYSAKVGGAYGGELSAFCAEELPDGTANATFLASKIVALGGEPTTVAKPVPEAGDAKAMLEAVREAEAGARTRYIQRAEQAERLGLKGLQVALEDMVRDETEHLEETERILRDWPL